MSFLEYNFRTRGEVPSGVENVGQDKTQPARVIDIILDSDHPKYSDYDGPNSCLLYTSPSPRDS